MNVGTFYEANKMDGPEVISSQNQVEAALIECQQCKSASRVCTWPSGTEAPCACCAQSNKPFPVTRIGYVLICDVKGHLIWRAQQGNIAKMLVIAGGGKLSPTPGKPVQRRACSFNTPSSLILVCDDSKGTSKEHDLVRLRQLVFQIS